MQINTNISQVRELVRSRLARLVNDSEAQISQSYQVIKNQLVGVHFTFGNYSVVWKFSEPIAIVTLEGTEVMRIEVAAPQETQLRRAG
jgi:hypothetical protein